MTTITLRVADKANAMRKLKNLDDKGGTLKKPMDKALFRLQNVMAKYPPPPPNSSYVRTGTLGRKWTTAKHKISDRLGGIQGIVGNNTPYGPFVQDATWQARIHRNRWRTTQDAIDENKDWIERELSRALEKET